MKGKEFSMKITSGKSKLWAIGILLLGFMIACFVTWVIIPPLLNSPLKSIEFPLSEKWSTKLQRNIQQITVVDNSIVIVRTMTKVYALDLQSGNVLWQQKISWHFSNRPPIVKNGMIYLSDGKGVVALDQLDGKILWQQALRHPSISKVLDVTQDLVAVNDPPYLTVFKAADGVFQWEKDICRGLTQAYFFDNQIVVPCYELSVFNMLSGDTVWETQSGDHLDRIWKSAFADGVIYFAQDFEIITAYDVINRKLEWETPLAEKYDSHLSYKILNNYLSVTIFDQLCIFYRKDGRRAWCTGNLIKPTNPTSINGVLYLMNGLKKGITAYDLHDGRKIGRLDFPSYIFITFENDKQLMVASDELLIFTSGDKIFAYGK